MTNDFKPFGAGHDQDPEAADRQVLRNLPVALSGRHRHGRRAEHLQAVLAGLLRPDRDRRMPSRQRRRRFGLARNPRLLLIRHPDRPDRHAQGNQRRFQHRLLRRADLHLLAQARHRRRLSRALQGRAHRHRQRRRWLAARQGQDRQARQRDRRPHLQPEGFRPDAGAGKAHRAGGQEDHASFCKQTDRFDKTIVFCEDIDHAERMRQALVNENADLVARKPQIRHAHHRRQRRRQGRTGQLHRSRRAATRSSPPPPS